MQNNDLLGNIPVISSLEGELIPTSSTDGGYVQGFRDGLSVGVTVGYGEAIAQIQNILPELIRQAIMNLPDVKTALSDGLRHGSPSCGKALVEIYRYGNQLK
ncbi:hypothetical protein EKN56_20025 [Limnobaculum zhutongyuii]|uniref:Uncharacterized protein n=1 Tax=Limnobaculum zhutongyuii TaxID=2498113 RepID=A0A411WQH7_9GAMM|nr:hypothetical protein [Limnobaculum zhutongyuii]QBH98479.1 hypothetical protein EKN56_20025 [Limnobaculum zhutongyuii]TQS90074.1 hypothetical protein ELQ32_04210 [Limnobaculum zhutongyuii]